MVARADIVAKNPTSTGNINTMHQHVLVISQAICQVSSAREHQQPHHVPRIAAGTPFLGYSEISGWKDWGGPGVVYGEQKEKGKQ